MNPSLGSLGIDLGTFLEREFVDLEAADVVDTFLGPFLHSLLDSFEQFVAARESNFLGRS